MKRPFFHSLNWVCVMFFFITSCEKESSDRYSIRINGQIKEWTLETNCYAKLCPALKLSDNFNAGFPSYGNSIIEKNGKFNFNQLVKPPDSLLVSLESVFGKGIVVNDSTARAMRGVLYICYKGTDHPIGSLIKGENINSVKNSSYISYIYVNKDIVISGQGLMKNLVDSVHYNCDLRLNSGWNEYNVHNDSLIFPSYYFCSIINKVPESCIWKYQPFLKQK